jgi:hypothetical protein
MVELNYQRKANRRWPKAEWITGDGRYASVARCQDALTIELHQTRQDALLAKARIDSTGCCGGCNNLHSVIDLLAEPHHE